MPRRRRTWPKGTPDAPSAKKNGYVVPVGMTSKRVLEKKGRIRSGR